MKHDPFGNLRDWGAVLDLLDTLSKSGNLAECQPGLVRILKFKGNWRLREEVLKRIGAISAPSIALVDQVIDVMADDNTYYDARILAADALMQLWEKGESEALEKAAGKVKSITGKLRNIPQPPFFEDALDRLSLQMDPTRKLEN